MSARPCTASWCCHGLARQVAYLERAAMGKPLELDTGLVAVDVKTKAKNEKTLELWDARTSSSW